MAAEPLELTTSMGLGTVTSRLDVHPTTTGSASRRAEETEAETEVIRIVVPTQIGGAVSDPSVTAAVGVVVRVEGGNYGVEVVHVDLDEDVLRARLSERRGAF
jgi:predicted metal-dependent peptidase